GGLLCDGAAEDAGAAAGGEGEDGRDRVGGERVGGTRRCRPRDRRAAQEADEEADDIPPSHGLLADRRPRSGRGKSLSRRRRTDRALPPPWRRQRAAPAAVTAA